MKRRPLLLVVVVAALALLAIGAFAHADGPGGSTEHHQDCTNNSTGVTTHDVQGSCPSGSTSSTHYTNEVTCGSNAGAGGIDVFVGPSGFEICSGSDSSVPLEGRVMASGDPGSQSGYVGADGDASNPGQGAGWIGVSSEAGTPVACGDEAGNRDLSHADGDDDIQDCAP